VEEVKESDEAADLSTRIANVVKKKKESTKKRAFAGRPPESSGEVVRGRKRFFLVPKRVWTTT
jgi:hypothetical protein